MKKYLIALVLGLLVVAAFATTALADNGPHGGFNGSTDACASCHRAHSAISSDGFLLVASNVYSLCTSCHDGTGAFTNVVDGYYDTTIPAPDTHGKAGTIGGPLGSQGEAGLGLFAGGFVNTRMLTDFGTAANAAPTTNTGALLSANMGGNINDSATAWSITNAYDTALGYPLNRAVTSNHDVSTALRSGTVWGSGNINPAGTLADNWGAAVFTGGTELECTSCHDPHGNAGRQGGIATGAPYPSYRILRFQPNGSNGFEVAAAVGAGTGYAWNTAAVPSSLGVQVPDPAVVWYTPNSNVALDPTLRAYRGRVGGGEVFVAVFAGLGDYGSRYHGYMRPAVTITAATTGTIYSCPNGSGLPTTPGTACPAAPAGVTNFNNVPAQDKLGFWCATCHDRYLAQGGASRTTDSTDPGYHYRHRSQGNGTTANQYTCVSCHNAHGTSAQVSALAGGSGLPGVGASYAGGSVLLKADNRAICVRCHAGAVNFFNVTTSPTAPMVYP